MSLKNSSLSLVFETTVEREREFPRDTPVDRPWSQSLPRAQPRREPILRENPRVHVTVCSERSERGGVGGGTVGHERGNLLGSLGAYAPPLVLHLHTSGR